IERLKNNTQIAKTLNHAGNLKSIQVTEKDKAEMVHKLILICSKKNISISGHQLLETMRDKIKSLNFKLL
ncbi:MAG: hypothetical protein L6276_01620, partial [Acetobacterium sp.]|nr:hypothetical protein [Acetobacterium sp.]